MPDNALCAPDDYDATYNVGLVKVDVAQTVLTVRCLLGVKCVNRWMVSGLIALIDMHPRALPFMALRFRTAHMVFVDLLYLLSC